MKQPVVEWTLEDLKQVLSRAQTVLSAEDYQTLKAVVETLAYLTHLAKDKQAAEIRRILGQSKSEKTQKILDVLGLGSAAGPEGKESESEPAAENTLPATVENPKPKPAGHGRNGANSYTGARRIRVPLESMKAGDHCAECLKGRLYGKLKPAVLVRIVGQAPLQATIYELDTLRCNLCGEVFTAEAPEGVGEEKYDATSSSMVAMMKYGSGMPFYRLAGLQQSLGIPLPVSTQWDIVRDMALLIQPAFEELIRQAAQGEVLYNDDTSVKILEFLKPGYEDPDFAGRTGVFTTGIVSTYQGRKIALFFSGRKHAGENITDVLAERVHTLPPPIQMCDASSRNLPCELEIILANCIVHARRRFVDVVANFPEECRYVLEILAVVYRNEAETRNQAMTPAARLQFHQERSGPPMERLRVWMTEQLDQKRVEPNSGLGSAIRFLRKHWEPMTLFLRVAGAPLDNNICERSLKKAILHRKNAMFYKTQRGARVGDLFMSLIHTCQFVHADPFDYLTALHRNAGLLLCRPQDWMPWNYHQTLSAIETGDLNSS